MNTIAQHIRFISVDDDNLDLFEGQYPLTAGISYNSYLIEDKDIAIVDAVDARRCRQWLDAIGRTGLKPRYLIVQHMEPDHSAGIGALMARYPDMQVVSTAKAAAMMADFFEDTDFGGRCITVADGDTLSLGRTELRFITAPMVHWPEVMVTLDTTDGILFSADAFGSFATAGDPEAWTAEARRYYTNIVGRFGASVQALMRKLAGLSFSVIAPLHGPVLSGNLAPYWQLYDKWSRYEPETRGVLVAYASVYGATAEAARLLADMLREADAGDVVLLDLCRHDVSHAVAQAFRLSSMALCSATCDADVMPAMHTFLHHIRSKNLRGRHVGLVENGSWAPQAARIMADTLADMKDITIVSPIVTIHSRLHRADHTTLRHLAQALAEK